MPEAHLNEIEALDRKHVFTSWSYQRDAAPKQVVDADGVRFTDADGMTYLDLSSQLMCCQLGHNDPRITQAIADQAQRVAYVAPKKFTTEVRGLGLFWGLELVKDRDTKEPMPEDVLQAFAGRCMELGAHIITMRNVVIFAPPLVIADDELDEGISLIDQALEVADQHTSVEPATA